MQYFDVVGDPARRTSASRAVSCGDPSLTIVQLDEPDETWGQVVMAAPAGTSVTDLELDTWLAGHIARHKIARRLMWMDELPRDATGKVLEAELRRHYPTAGSG